MSINLHKSFFLTLKHWSKKSYSECGKEKRKKKRFYRHFPCFRWRVTVLCYGLSEHNRNRLNLWRLVKLKITRNNKKLPPKKSFIYSLRMRWEPFRKKNMMIFGEDEYCVFYTISWAVPFWHIRRILHEKKNERIKKKELLNFTFYLFKLSLVQKWFGRIIYNFTCASRVKKKIK